MHRRPLAPPALAALLVLGACTPLEPPATPPDPAEVFAARQLPGALTADVNALVRGNTEFACEIYTRFAATDGNVFLSPFSLSTALCMLHAGARGATREEIAWTLHLPAGGAGIDTLYRVLLESLDRGVSFGGYRLDVADGVWVQKDFAILPEFARTLTDDYHATSASADFRGAPETSRRAINAWVADHTSRKITELFPAGSISELTRLALVNAVYFTGRWSHAFDSRDTREEPFHVNDARTVTVPMMSLSDTLPFAGMNGFDIVELPYGAGDIVMDVIVPSSTNGLAQVEAALTADALAAWRARLHVQRIDLKLPRFTVRQHASLRGMLSAMGMPTVFTEAADLTGISEPGGLAAQAVEHEAFVSVNEEGTEAAAATGVSVGVVSVPPSIVADRPFLFVIRDRVTGSVLFMGRVVEPRD